MITSESSEVLQPQTADSFESTPETPYKPEGKQARATFEGINPVARTSEEVLAMLTSVVKRMGATIIEGTQMHQSLNGGSYLIAGMGLEESSAFIHVFLDSRKATADIFTCGDTVDPRDGMFMLDRELAAKKTLVTFTGRGETSIEPEEIVIA